MILAFTTVFISKSILPWHLFTGPNGMMFIIRYKHSLWDALNGGLRGLRGVQLEDLDTHGKWTSNNVRQLDANAWYDHESTSLRHSLWAVVSHREFLYLMMNIMPLGPVNRCQGRIDLDINTVVKASIISYTVPRYTSQVRSRRTEAPLNRIAAVVYPF